MTTLYCPQCGSKTWDFIGVLNEEYDAFFAKCEDCGIETPIFHTESAYRVYWTQAYLAFMSRKNTCDTN